MKSFASVIGLATLLAAHAEAREFHVSPQGSDRSVGSEAEPFKTLARARDAVRAVNADMAQDIVVLLHDGTYPVTETIAFDTRDSGRNGHKVIYSAAPGSKPVLSGGTDITGWTPHDKTNGIYEARTVKTPFRQLYVDGAMAVRARYPNRESRKDNSPYWACKVPEIPKMRIKNDYWKTCSTVPIGKRAEVEIVMISHWYHQRIRVGTVKTVGNEVEITPASPKGKFTKHPGFYRKNGRIDNPFYFENAREFIDVPYEWYHDAGEGIVYMAFPRGIKPDGVRVEAPVTETLIAVVGTAEAPVRDLEFRGLIFELANWGAPSKEGANMTQAAQNVGGEMPKPMVLARHVERLAFRSNTFRRAGGQGLELYNADFSDVEGNTFRSIAANGIIIDRETGRNPTPDKQSVGVAIWNNQATECGSNYSNGMFLFANNVKGLIVAHNLIHNLPYSAMQIGNQPGKIQDVGCAQNTIINNHIHHCTQIHGDGGGVYTLGGIQTGTVISGNHIHDIHQPVWDRYHVDHIYLDNFSSKITVKDNVVNGGKAVERNGSKGNSLSNNTQSNPAVEKNAGIKPGYSPRKK
jgi:hypothetical protein